MRHRRALVDIISQLVSASYIIATILRPQWRTATE